MKEFYIVWEVKFVLFTVFFRFFVILRIVRGVIRDEYVAVFYYL